jgi:phosphomannomutase
VTGSPSRNDSTTQANPEIGRSGTLWDTSITEDGVVLFEHHTGECLAVRACGTEPGTRLYIEAASATTDRLIDGVSAIRPLG